MRTRILALVMGLCLITSFAFADVVGEVVSIDPDENGNIRVWTTHSIDGKEVASQYPKIDGHYVYCTRYSKQNFKDLSTVKEIEDYILNDIKDYDEGLVQKEFDKKAPKTVRQIQVDYNTVANQTFSDTSLDKLVGKTISATEKTYRLDTDNDGVLDKEVTIKQDGTNTITDIISP